MQVLAVVPANDPLDAGRNVGGRPLVAHTILAARAARSIEGIAVFTGDARVARVAGDLGVLVVDGRFDRRAVDGDREAVLSCIEAVVQRGGTGTCDVAVVLDPACPLRTPAEIDQAVGLFRASAIDSMISVHSCGAPLWIRDGAGAVSPSVVPDGEGVYQQNQALAVVRVSALAQAASFPCGRIGVFEVPRIAGLSIIEDPGLVSFEQLLRRRHDDLASALLAGVRMLVLDFDGVMSDNRVIVLEDGREAVLCSRGDGLGLELLRKSGMPIAVISKEGNPVVSARCRKLKIPCEQGIEDKLTVLERIAGEQGILLDAIAYVGNDVNDLACLDAVGTAIAPSDAHPAVLERVDLVTIAAGGMGCVREICDLLLAR